MVNPEDSSPVARTEIEGRDGLLLRELAEEDAQTYFDLIDRDREHFAEFGQETLDKYQTVQDVLDSIHSPDPERQRFGIWAEGRMVGSINLDDSERPNASEIGYWVGGEHKGHGYAARAVEAIIPYALGRPDIQYLFANVDSENEASRKTLEKCGFKIAEDDGNWLEYELRPTVPQEVERELDYGGRRLCLKDVQGDPYGNPIHGFEVSLAGTAYELAHAKCWEGMYLGKSGDEGENLIEDDILEVSGVSNHTGENGIGALLTRFVLEEGKRRGFNQARLIIHNPKIISIIEKLRQDDQPPLTGAAYFEDYPLRPGYPSSSELKVTRRELTAEQGKNYLQRFPANSEGFVDSALVDCLLEL